MPNFLIVGLPDDAVREARERVWGAIKNTGLVFPMRRITVNLASADQRKRGFAAFLRPTAGAGRPACLRPAGGRTTGLSSPGGLSKCWQPMLKVLRVRIEVGVVRVARSKGTLTVPARFMLVGARNPCPYP